MQKSTIGTIFFAACILSIAFGGCKTNEISVKCPELSSASRHHPLFLAKGHPAKATPDENTQAAVSKAAPKDLLASAATTLPVQIKLPDALLEGNDGKDIDATNKVLNQYSNGRVSVQQKANGKVYLASKSLKDLFVLTSNLSKSMLRPRGYYEQRYGQDHDAIAMAGGAIGFIAFIFSFIPILDLLAIPMGLAGIILGAIGLRSHRRHIAIMGIVFGALALFIAPLLAFVYYFGGPHLIFFW